METIALKKRKTKIDEQYGFTDIDGASIILGLSKSKLYKACSEGTIKFYKPCGKLFFKITELLAWIEVSKQ